jgi:hypothetical protein
MMLKMGAFILRAAGKRVGVVPRLFRLILLLTSDAMTSEKFPVMTSNLIDVTADFSSMVTL